MYTARPQLDVALYIDYRVTYHLTACYVITGTMFIGNIVGLVMIGLYTVIMI